MPREPAAGAQRPRTIREALDGAAHALSARRLGEAERLAAYVLKSDRGNLEAARLLGQALLLQGRAADAEAALAAVVRRRGDPAVETLLARALADQGRTEAALERLGQATARRPAYPLAFLELGDLLGRLGRADEAAAAFEAGIALAPDALVLKVGVAYLRLQANDRREARRLFGEVHEAAPSRPDALVGLARTLAADGDHAGAAGLYRRALAIQPQDAPTRIALGRSLLELGDRTGGEAALRAAAQAGGAVPGMAVTALAGVGRGRAFLRPGAAAAFLRD